MAARMRPTTLKKRHSVSVWIYVVHAVLGLGAVVLLHARVAVDREGYATPTHYAREPREVEVVGDAHACVSARVPSMRGPSRVTTRRMTRIAVDGEEIISRAGARRTK